MVFIFCFLPTQFDLPSEIQKTPEEDIGSKLISLSSENLDLVSSKEDEEVRFESADLAFSKKYEEYISLIRLNR
ncbi:hypothetical protein AVEN_55878-1, partial [Araneus ventricosus]